MMAFSDVQKSKQPKLLSEMVLSKSFEKKGGLKSRSCLTAQDILLENNLHMQLRIKKTLNMHLTLSYMYRIVLSKCPYPSKRLPPLFWLFLWFG